MSQQINLLLDELRPKRDLLAFPFVAGGMLAVVLAIAGMAGWGQLQVRSLVAVEAQSAAEMNALQQQVQALGQTLAGRAPNAALQAEIDRLNESLRQREQALRVLEGGKPGDAAGHASLMRGFARQVMEGVWLTGFVVSGQEVEIRGRLADPGLLPQYIRRLNNEAGFQGRRFSALDMKDSGAVAVVGAPADSAAGAKAPRYTEFALRGNPGKPMEQAP